MISSLEELSKAKSRFIRDEEANQELEEEEKELADRAADIKQHFIDPVSGK